MWVVRFGLLTWIMCAACVESIASTEASPLRFKVGFEFQESNHIFNQNEDKNKRKIPPSDIWLKKPLLEFYLQDKQKKTNRKIFHIEIDDVDLEVVTVPFSSDEKEFLRIAIKAVNLFVNIFYEVINRKQINNGANQVRPKNLDQLISTLMYELIKNDEFLDIPIHILGELDPSQRAVSSHIFDCKKYKLIVDKKTFPASGEDVKIHSSRYRLTRDFNPQFTVQCDLNMFLIFYNLFFYNNNIVKYLERLKPENNLGQVCITPKETSDIESFIYLCPTTASNVDVRDPMLNWSMLFLMTMVRTGICSSIDLGQKPTSSKVKGSTAHEETQASYNPQNNCMLEKMIENLQCDYKMGLNVMSRLSFSDLLPNRQIDWRCYINEYWAVDFIARIVNGFSKSNFGDFYPNAEKLSPYIKEYINDIKEDINASSRNALEMGIITTDILRKLPEDAFKESQMKRMLNQYIDQYGWLIYNSVGKTLPFYRKIEIEPFGDKYVVNFSSPELQDNDLLSPPFPVLPNNAMGTFPKMRIDPLYGDALFEVRAVGRFGELAQKILKNNSGVNCVTFLRAVQDSSLERDAVALFDMLSIRSYNVEGKSAEGYVISKVQDIFSGAQRILNS